MSFTRNNISTSLQIKINTTPRRTVWVLGRFRNHFTRFQRRQDIILLNIRTVNQ